MNSNEKAVIEISNLEKIYSAGTVKVPALRDITFTARKGEFLSIMGPSGCGKSTLLYVIAGLTTPTAGSVRIDGREITRLSDTALSRLRARKIGFVFQRFNLLPTLTVEGNIELAQEIRSLSTGDSRRIDEILELVGLSSKKGRKPAELSMGEQQRVAIARAIVHDPAILLADEPTGNLDSANAETIMRIFSRMNRTLGQTIMLVTHNREVAETADGIVRMKDGKIIQEPVGVIGS